MYDRRAGNKIRKTFRNLNEAKSWRRDAGAAVERGTMGTPTKLTLREFANDWLDKAERGEILARTRKPYKPSTLRGYRHDRRSTSTPTWVLRGCQRSAGGIYRPSLTAS